MSRIYIIFIFVCMLGLSCSTNNHNSSVTEKENVSLDNEKKIVDPQLTELDQVVCKTFFDVIDQAFKIHLTRGAADKNQILSTALSMSVSLLIDLLKDRKIEISNTALTNLENLKTHNATVDCNTIQDLSQSLSTALSELSNQKTRENKIQSSTSTSTQPTTKPIIIIARNILYFVFRLLDPFSAYLPPTSENLFGTGLKIWGAGLKIQKRLDCDLDKNPQFLVVEGIYPRSLNGSVLSIEQSTHPKITKINGTPVSSRSYYDNIVSLNFRDFDEEESQITINIEGRENPISLSLNSYQYNFVHSQEYKVPNGNRKVLYIQLSSFEAGSNAAIDMYREWLRELGEAFSKNSSSVKGIILDLRDNRGGWEFEMQTILEMFLPANTLIGVKVVRKTNESSEVRTAHDSVVDNSIPLIVLINEHTASAGEITAGVLKVYKTALILGSSSSKGKAVGGFETNVPSPLEGKNYTIELDYYLPDGSSYQNKGISPHILLQDPVAECQKTAKQRIYDQNSGVYTKYDKMISGFPGRTIQTPAAYQLTFHSLEQEPITDDVIAGMSGIITTGENKPEECKQAIGKDCVLAWALKLMPELIKQTDK